MKYILRLILFVHLCVLSLDSFAKLPSWYDGYIEVKTQQIKSLAADQADGFIFWTDTHLSTKKTTSGELISTVVEGLDDPKVIFGGDVVVNFGDIDSSWRYQQMAEDEVRAAARFYRARGNHDFTGKTFKDEIPYTFSQEKTGRMMRESMTSEGVVRNLQDPNSCYFYFDEPAKKIRYLVFDTTDSVLSEDVFGLKTGIGEVQRQWMFSEGLMKAPEAYSIIVIAHISKPKYLSACLSALSAHTSYDCDGIEYDFSTRKDLKLLFCISGHSHFDIQRYSGGVLYIIHNSDAPYKDYAMDPLYTGEIVSRTNNVIEHSFSYVSVDKSRSQVRMLRVGCGVNSLYNLEPVVLKAGKKLSLKSSLKDVARWDVYDSDAAVFVKYKKLGIPSPNGLKGRVEIVREIASIRPDGTLKGLSAGDAVAVAISQDGSREFFCIKVE